MRPLMNFLRDPLLPHLMSGEVALTVATD